MPLDLVVNPNFWLEPSRLGGEVVRVTILAPVKGRGLQYFYADRKEQAEMFRLVVAIDKAQRHAGSVKPVAIPENFREQLYQMGVLVREDEISLPVRFHCFLSEETLEWIPQRCRQELSFDSDPSRLIVNPTFAFQTTDLSPEAYAHRIQIYDQFLTGYPLVWIENPGTHLLTAYWVRPEDSKFLSLMKPGDRPPLSLDPKLQKVLEMARILVPEDYPGRCRREWEKLIGDLRAQFKSRFFATLSDILPPFQLGALRRYFRQIVAEGYLQKGYVIIPSRQLRHHEDMLCFFHHQLSYLFSRIAGRPLRASHDYFYLYENSSALHKHVDIDQEEFAVSLLLDYEPEPSGISPWPLFLESPAEGEIEISQEIGNAVFYNGSDLPHYRHILPAGHRSASVVFHYVPQNFRGV